MILIVRQLNENDCAEGEKTVCRSCNLYVFESWIYASQPRNIPGARFAYLVIWGDRICGYSTRDRAYRASDGINSARSIYARNERPSDPLTALQCNNTMSGVRDKH